MKKLGKTKKTSIQKLREIISDVVKFLSSVVALIGLIIKISSWFR